MHFVGSYISGYFSTNDDECRRTQYDDEGVHGEQLTINAKLTIVNWLMFEAIQEEDLRST